MFGQFRPVDDEEVIQVRQKGCNIIYHQQQMYEVTMCLPLLIQNKGEDQETKETF
jgi:hypothetical protein